MRQKYQFPEKDAFKISEVMHPEFDILPFWKDLYVDLDEIRGVAQREEIKYELGIKGEELVSIRTEPVKIIYSGHLGSGKTLELHRLYKEIHGRKRYFTIFVDFAKSSGVTRLQAEDFFVIIIANLIQSLKKEALPFSLDKFNQIAEGWLSQSDIRKELTESYGFQAGVNANVKISFWDFFSLEGKMSDLLSSDSKTITTIRRVIRQNTDFLIKQLNEALAEVRKTLKTSGEGRDILFILDNSEKMQAEVYKQLFVTDSFLIREMNAHLICAVPISSFYEISFTQTTEYFISMILPMVKITDENIDKFSEIIKRRIDVDLFFAENVLAYCAKMSGGCPRQFIRIVHLSIRKALGKRITREIAENACKVLGQELWERLNQKHRETLKTQMGNYPTGQNEVKEMLFGLQLLKYNGLIIPNPLLKPYLE